MATRSFYCSICRKNTIHDEVSYAEHDALRGYTEYSIGNAKLPKWFSKLSNRIADHTGIYKALRITSDFNGFWKCRECLHSSARKKDGSIDIENNSF